MKKLSIEIMIATACFSIMGCGAHSSNDEESITENENIAVTAQDDITEEKTLEKVEGKIDDKTEEITEAKETSISFEKIEEMWVEVGPENATDYK